MRLATRLARAVALGVGTIFGWKTSPDAHWSEAPNHIELAEQAEDDDSGDPWRRRR